MIVLDQGGAMAQMRESLDNFRFKHLLFFGGGV